MVLKGQKNEKMAGICPHLKKLTSILILNKQEMLLYGSCKEDSTAAYFTYLRIQQKAVTDVSGEKFVLQKCIQRC